MKNKPLEIVTYGDDILKKVAEPITDIDDDLLQLVKKMIITMQDAGGVGLAAPQVGASRQLITILLDPEKGKTIALLNPKIVVCEGDTSGEEGCLSFPGITGEIKRNARVVIEATNTKGVPIEIEAEELLSRVLQHEIDHLNGILFIERMSYVRRKLLNKKLKQLKNETLARLAAK